MPQGGPAPAAPTPRKKQGKEKKGRKKEKERKKDDMLNCNGNVIFCCSVLSSLYTVFFPFIAPPPISALPLFFSLLYFSEKVWIEILSEMMT